jgi:hypothetical protein
MMGIAEKLEVGDYDLKGPDLRSYYAAFGRRALPDGAIYTLAVAESALPDGHIGYEAWMTQVAGVPFFAPSLKAWSVSLARTAATLRPLLGKRRVQLVKSYRDDWGSQAARDGLCVALWGEKVVPGLEARATEFGCRWQAYKRIRDIVGGCVIRQIDDFESSLVWATRLRGESYLATLALGDMAPAKA